MPIIQWKRNDQWISDEDFESGFLTLSADGKHLTIVQSEIGDTGRYSCVATNVAGQSEKNFDVEVHGMF